MKVVLKEECCHLVLHWYTVETTRKNCGSFFTENITHEEGDLLELACRPIKFKFYVKPYIIGKRAPLFSSLSSSSWSDLYSPENAHTHTHRYGCEQRFRCCFKTRLVFSSPLSQKREDDDVFFLFCHDHQCEKTKRRNHRPESQPTKSQLELFRNVHPVLEIPRPRERLYSRGQSRVGNAENLSGTRGVVVR